MYLFTWLSRQKGRRKLVISCVLVAMVLLTIGWSLIPEENEEEIVAETKASEVETTAKEVSWEDEDFIFYFQDYDQPWSDLPHGGSTVRKSGCGTVSLAMCLANLTGDEKSYTPDKLAKYLDKHDMAAPNQDAECIPRLCEEMDTGCYAQTYYGNLDFDLVDETLKVGGYIILDQTAETGKKSNQQVFARLNHYIVIRAGNQKKGYKIANSLYGYSKEGSEVKYAPQNGTRIPKKMFQARYYYTIQKK